MLKQKVKSRWESKDKWLYDNNQFDINLSLNNTNIE